MLNQISIIPKEINQLNTCAKAMAILLALPNPGPNFPSFGNMEIYYDTSKEIGVVTQGKIIELQLYLETEEDETYLDYLLEPDDNGDFYAPIVQLINQHNSQGEQHDTKQSNG